MTVAMARPEALRSDAQRNRTALLDVARTFLDRGEQPLLNAVAHEAGVGVGTAYRHFPSQQHLLEALAIDAFEDMLDRVRDAVALSDTGDALRGVVTTAFRSMVQDDALGDLLTGGGFSCADTLALAGDLVASVDALLARGRAEGLVRADLDADDLRRLLCGMRTAAVAGGRRVEAPDRYAEVLLAGIGPV
ncbi:TetR/AcrR family transcriptional regulator [Curtobacterium sp. VKM Ac-1376]|uniref:TetR/AcrR family transcriptional regulator n=1 Tax=Curtobacterium sp. VKM Ac-1376 TaxID=123312 RepID=UPI00188AC6C2|nr:TetR/AcrR family transcriptional regulator [Curtobacterium sp. VKM Ac-1376]MBF4615646.1 TetR/AcrR family transcriptional regulator [Curtobacterium sp. VKM Ac-1376]